MRTITRPALIVTVLVCLSAAAGLSLAAADQRAGPTNSPTPYVVHIKNFAFNPASLTVPLGATVLFKNEDTVAHTATAPGKNGFDSGNLDGGAEFKYVFSKAGKFDYVCNYHPKMKASIVVGAESPAASPTPAPTPTQYVPSGY